MQRLVALTQGLLVGRAGRLWGGCSLVADRPNACWEAWGLVRELTGQCPRMLRWLVARGSLGGGVDLAEHWRSG